MKEYVVKYNRSQQLQNLFAYIGEAQTVKFDLTPWEEDNGSVSSVTWSTKAGDAAISNESLTSSIASAVITMSSEGASLIKLTATTGTNTHVTYIRVVSKDPETTMTALDYR